MITEKVPTVPPTLYRNPTLSVWTMMANLKNLMDCKKEKRRS